MRHFLISFAFIAAPAVADVPQVVADIAPVHGIVSRVMEGVGTPKLLLPATASPHSYAMRPSEARALAQADLVVWVGPELTPWLVDAMGGLAENAVQMALLQQASSRALPAREGVNFDVEAEGDDHDHDHDHGHADEDGHEDEEHAAIDPHAWLDPASAMIWADGLADQLALMDPDNAAAYAANAVAFKSDMTAYQAKWTKRLEVVSGQPFVVLHDAFQYFERSHGLRPPVAVSLGDAAAPGAARISALKTAVRDSGVVCAFHEPQQNTSMIDLVTEGLNVKSATLDPMGSTLALGPDHYVQTLEGMADTFLGCLSP